MPEEHGPSFAGGVHLLSETKLQTCPPDILYGVYPNFPMENLTGSAEYQSWGGSLSNTLFWLIQFGHKVNVVGTVGNDQVGQDLSQSTDYDTYHLSISPGNSGRFTYFTNTTTGEPLAIFYNYGVTAKISYDETIKPDTCLIGGFELQTIDNFETLIYPANRYIINLGGVRDTEKFSKLMEHLANKKVVVVGNIAEIEKFNDRFNPDTIVVTTKAAEGAEIKINNDVIASTKPYNDRPIVDVMGAGDAFLAKFLSDWFKSNFSEDREMLVNALQNAVNFATLVSTYPGARPNAIIDLIQQQTN